MISMAILAAGCAVILSLLSKGHPDVRVLTLWMGLHGLFTNGVMTTLYSLSAHIYKADVRSTDSGAALSVGRIGAIVGYSQAPPDYCRRDACSWPWLSPWWDPRSA